MFLTCGIRAAKWSGLISQIIGRAMYDNHVPLISACMRETLEGFKRGLTFVVCSIRQSITVVPDQVAALWDNAEEEESPLFGHKWNAWQFILSPECEALWRRVRDCYDAEKVIIEVSQIPGLGIVKAGFVAQLMGCDVACLDSRNEKRDGRKHRAYRSYGIKDTKAFRRKIARYVADTGGKARYYWDIWCNEVAEARKIDPEKVSALHLAILPPNYVPGF